MRVEFELDRDDFAAFVRSEWESRTRHGPTPRMWALLGAVLALAVVLGVVLTLASGGTEWANDPVVEFLLYAIAVVLGLLLLVTAMLRLMRRIVLAAPPRDAAMLGWRTIELTDEGVVETTASAVELTPWQSVREVRETPVQIHLCLDGMAAHVIPKRAFASAAEAARFADHARQRGLGSGAIERSASGWSKPV